MLPFLVIEIPWSPNIGHLGPFLITWHGVFAVLGTLLSCSLVAYGLAMVDWRGRELLFWIMLSLSAVLLRDHAARGRGQAGGAPVAAGAAAP